MCASKHTVSLVPGDRCVLACVSKLKSTGLVHPFARRTQEPACRHRNWSVKQYAELVAVEVAVGAAV